MTSWIERASRRRGWAAGCATAWVMFGGWVASACAAGTHPVSHQARAAGRWAMLLAVAALLIGLPAALIALQGLFWAARSALHQLGGLTRRITGRKAPRERHGAKSSYGRPRWISPIGFMRGVVIGEDGQVSTSKVGAAVWTYAVSSALLSLIVAKWLGHPQAINAHGSIQTEYAVLVGGPLGAAILAKGIVSSQMEKSDLPTGGRQSDEPDVRQLVTNSRGETDLGDLQYVLFNTIALVYFLGEFFRVPTNGLPNLPDLLVGLTSVSAVGYVAKKALPSSQPSPDLTAEAERQFAAQESGITTRAADLDVGDTSKDDVLPEDDADT
jgi:hypothetical protein